MNKKTAKEKAIALDAQKKYFPLNWKVDSSKNSLIDFKGYRAKQKPSVVSGKNRLYYDRKEPVNTLVKYLDSYQPTDSVAKPFAYIIPFAWKEVIERLRANQIKIERKLKWKWSEFYGMTMNYSMFYLCGT
jgi:hypothetical protein